MSGLRFTKMSGAGNDFIVVDNRSGALDRHITAKFVASVCRRGLSVGADGLIEILSSRLARFRMRYRNSDGRVAGMCGNGARCAVRFAADTGIVPPSGVVEFESDRGVHRAEIEESGEVRVWLQDPVVQFLDKALDLGASQIRASLVDTGVPHAVVFVDDLSDGEFERSAPALRHHPGLGPAGANADFVRACGGGLELRTWERGVEGETLACGTGAVAAALAASSLQGTPLPVDIGTRGGLTLTVGRDDHGWWLRGEARTVFRGELVSP